jgi:hypothetical protein
MTNRKAVEAYPLSWPEGWPRTESPGYSKFKTATDKARKKLLTEVALMGGTSTIISSNVPLRTDGQMRADREPVDAGVAVYFQRNEKGMVFACDRYDSVKENLHALALTIEALRGIERWGASEMMERAFSGFKQLAAENEGDSWWKTLQIHPDATIAEIETSYKAMAKFAHPDQPGGSHSAMTVLNAAREQALNVAKQRS